MNNKERKIIQAGGGLVENEKGEVLFMYRRGKWDLPKGKLDPGENLADCAIREVKEETGIRNLELDRFLVVTEHNYQERGFAFIKKTHWWLMKANSNQTLTPQAEEEITELKWIGKSGLPGVLNNTFPNIIDVLKSANLPGV